jgi:ABC-type lipoprotein release transport system permease subunit
MRGLFRIIARKELRSHWRGWLALVLLVGIGGGVVLAALAGARRTESAFPRLVEASTASDVVVVGDSGAFGFIGNVDLDEVARLPEVEATAETAVSVVFTGSTDSGERVGPGQLFPFSTDDRRVGRDIERWHLVEGRRADPDRMDEATATVGLAEEFGVEVGDELRLRFTQPEDFNTLVALLLSDPPGRLRAAAEGGGPVIDQLPAGPDVRVRVVGIEASPAEFPPVSAIVAPPLHLTEAFYEEHGDDTIGSPLMFVRLRNGSSDLPSFTRRVEALAGGNPVSFLTTLGNNRQKVGRSAGVEATALRLLGAVVAVATAFVFGQAARRQLLTSSGDGGTLRALGLTTRELTNLAVARIAAVGAVGALVAVLVALALSPLTPIGLARFAETNPGVRVDELVLGLGAVAVFAATVLLGLPGVSRAVRVSRGAVREQVALERPGRLVRLLTAIGAPPTAVMGMGAAIGPGAAGSARAGSGNLLSIVLAVALLMGSASFSASLGRLLDTPTLYGWTWDVTEGAPALPDIGAPLGNAFREDDAVSDVASATTSQVAIGDLRVDILGLEQTKGNVVPTMVEGRAPEGPDEAAMGTRTMRQADVRLGEDVELTLGGREGTYRVVGRAVFPDLGDAGGFGRGVLTTVEGVRRLLPSAPVNTFLLRFADGVDVDRQAEVVATAFDPVPSRGPERPSDLENLARVDRVPGVLAAVLLTLALATLAHTLLSSLRRRRRHLATLVSLGFVRRQLMATVLWQSVAEAAITLVVALPLGIAVGRWAWHTFAEDLGVPSEPVVPLAGLFLAVPVALVAAVLVGIGPAMLAARTRPTALRAAE